MKTKHYWDTPRNKWISVVVLWEARIPAKTTHRLRFNGRITVVRYGNTAAISDSWKTSYITARTEVASKEKCELSRAYLEADRYRILKWSDAELYGNNHNTGTLSSSMEVLQKPRVRPSKNLLDAEWTAYNYGQISLILVVTITKKSKRRFADAQHSKWWLATNYMLWRGPRKNTWVLLSLASSDHRDFGIWTLVHHLLEVRQKYSLRRVFSVYFDVLFACQAERNLCRKFICRFL